ncbi:MAG: hypothetical protein ABSD47_14355 [Candidatus Methylomirabilota bacterium]|jgi:hypothetical protein
MRTATTRRSLPPPVKFTFADRYRIVLGVLAIGIGIVMLYRMFTMPGPTSLPALFVALAFIGFGAHRSWMARTRYREYRAHMTGERP